ncbi:MAG: hypothetical protein KF825_14115 [Ferruginibacter sp.]|nr:hypothetical protein [Ferruginibacter sp.]
MKFKLRCVRKAYCILFFCFVSLTVSAQQDSVTNLPNFLFPSFTNCLIKFKTGELKKAVVNYNVVDEELVFQQDNTYMTLESPAVDVIDTLYVGGRVFVPFNGTAFYELISHGNVNFYMQYKKDAELIGASTAYGVKSRAANATYRKQIYGGGAGAVDLRVPSEFQLNVNNAYYLEKDGSMHKFSTKRQFLKICSDKEKEITQYIKEHDTKFNNLANLKSLVDYCNEELYK